MHCGLCEAVAPDPGMKKVYVCALWPKVWSHAHEALLTCYVSLPQMIPPNFSLFDVVLEMRRQRPAAVQTEV